MIVYVACMYVLYLVGTYLRMQVLWILVKTEGKTKV